MRSGSQSLRPPVEVWAAPSPCGLGSRSIARAEGPARPSPAVRVSGLTADDRCRGSLRLAVAHNCDRRGSGGRPGCLHASAMAQDDRIGLTSSRGSSTAAMGGRPSWRTRANKVRSNGTAPDWPCDFNASSPPQSSGGSSRLPARAIVIAPRGRHGLTILSTTLQHNRGCPSWQHTSKEVAHWDRTGLAIRIFS